MTTPRPHAELAARYYADDTLRCWTKDGAGDWIVSPFPSWYGGCEYHVGHEPPPIKRTITLTVNGKEWELPEPLRDTPDDGAEVWYVRTNDKVDYTVWNGTAHDHDALSSGIYLATEADAQAWAEFDKWCRRGGV